MSRFKLDFEFQKDIMESMTTKTTKVKNGTITLPKELRKSWKGAKVFLRAANDTIVIKKIKKAAFWESWEKLRKVSKKVTKRDIKKAVAWARSEVNKR